jgi:anti-sigma factor RsiW
MMSWPTHRRMRRAVSAYLDSEVDPATAAAVAAHLRRCWACSGDAELIRMIKQSLGNLAGRHDDTLAAMRLRRRITGAS